MQQIKEIVRKLITEKKEMEAELTVHQVALRETPHMWRKNRADALEGIVRITDSLLTLLNVEQEFLVRRHLVDGLPWALLTEEYAAAWYEKDERTLKRIQARGISKMEKFASSHYNTITTLLEAYEKTRQEK